MLAERKIRPKELAKQIGVAEVNVALLKRGRMIGVRFETLAKICDVLECRPGDLLGCCPDDRLSTSRE